MGRACAPGGWRRCLVPGIRLPLCGCLPTGRSTSITRDRCRETGGPSSGCWVGPTSRSRHLPGTPGSSSTWGASAGWGRSPGPPPIRKRDSFPNPPATWSGGGLRGRPTARPATPKSTQSSLALTPSLPRPLHPLRSTPLVTIPCCRHFPPIVVLFLEPALRLSATAFPGGECAWRCSISTGRSR